MDTRCRGKKAVCVPTSLQSGCTFLAVSKTFANYNTSLSLKHRYLAERACCSSVAEHCSVSAIFQRNSSVNVENSSKFTKYLNRDREEQVWFLFSLCESWRKWCLSPKQTALISQHKPRVTLVLLCYSTLLQLTSIMSTKIIFTEVCRSNFVHVVCCLLQFFIFGAAG